MCVGKRSALGRQMNDPRFDDSRLSHDLFRCGDRLFQRFGQHDHARAAAVGSVVDGAIRIRGEIARISAVQGPQTALPGPPCHAVAGRDIDHLWKKRDDFDKHHGVPLFQ